MNSSIKYIVGLALTLSLFSCVQENKEVKGPFTDVVNFDTIAAQLNTGLVKNVVHSNRMESRFIKSPNWEVELKPFTDANFNRPANIDNYVRTEEVSSLSGWRDVTWVSTKESLPVKWAIYRYKDSKNSGSVLNVSKGSTGYEMEEVLTFIPGFGCAIDNSQSLEQVSDQNFYLSVDFEGGPQVWRMFFDVGDKVIPVNFNLQHTSTGLDLVFTQGKESISVSATKTDSGYLAEIPVFQSLLRFELLEESITGTFHNLDKGEDYIIPFTANKLNYEQVLSYNPTLNYPDFKGKWEVSFKDGDGSYAAIGMFDRLGNDLIGTFATETGDYRYLQGKVMGDSFSLSTFDGSHLFLFTGKINGTQITDGHFYSGSHYHTTWSGFKNEEFELQDPTKMTSLQNGVEKIDFSFPDLDGKMVSLSDERFQNKVVILQILGSWCPNCMDETRYFKELSEQYGAQGLEIIGLAFERSKDFEKAKESLMKSIEDLDVPYTMLIAGIPRESGDALPMITKIKSYPTSIFIDRNGEVVKIHTGFYGPSTGKYYDEFTTETSQLIEGLLK